MASMHSSHTRLRVTLVVGPPKSGKSALVQSLLHANTHANADEETVVIVSQELSGDVMSDADVGADRFVTQDGRVVVRPPRYFDDCGDQFRIDLVDEMCRIVAARKYNRVIIECGGSCNPVSVLESFVTQIPPAFLSEQTSYGMAAAESLGHPISTLDDIAVIEGVIASIVPSLFWEQWHSVAKLTDDPLNDVVLEDDDRTLVEILASQVTAAGAVVLQPGEDIESVRSALEALNPIATYFESTEASSEALLSASQKFQQAIHECAYDEGGDFQLYFIVQAGKHEFSENAILQDESTAAAATALSELNISQHNAVEGKKKLRSAAWLQTHSGILLRMKGTVWIAGYHRLSASLNQIGGFLDVDLAEPWAAAVAPKDRDAIFRGMEYTIDQHEFGDRRTELKFVSLGLDTAKLKSQLDSCLLTPEETAQGPSSWLDLPDPFLLSSTETKKADAENCADMAKERPTEVDVCIPMPTVDSNDGYEHFVSSLKQLSSEKLFIAATEAALFAWEVLGYALDEGIRGDEGIDIAEWMADVVVTELCKDRDVEVEEIQDYICEIMTNEFNVYFENDELPPSSYHAARQIRQFMVDSEKGGCEGMFKFMFKIAKLKDRFQEHMPAPQLVPAAETEQPVLEAEEEEEEEVADPDGWEVVKPKKNKKKKIVAT